MIRDVPTMLEWLLAIGEGGCQPHNPPDAQRFGIQLPLRYRAHGETAWHEGRTQNIGPAGVFFWAEHIKEVDTRIEMRFEVVVDPHGEIVAELVCQGEIVRMVLPSSMDASPGLAAKILEFRYIERPTISLAPWSLGSTAGAPLRGEVNSSP